MPGIRRETVADQSAGELRRRILYGDLRPGTPITEEAVAEELGVSRATVRQALNTLMLEGLLTRQTTTRVLQVTELSPGDVQDIFRARKFLELGGVDAAAHASPAGLARVQDAVLDLEKAAGDDDATAFLQADIRCHAAVVDLLGSRHLTAAHAQLVAKLRLGMTKVTVQTPDHDGDLARHQEFVALLVEGAVGQARENLSRRLDAAELAVVAMVARQA